MVKVEGIGTETSYPLGTVDTVYRAYKLYGLTVVKNEIGPLKTRILFFYQKNEIGITNLITLKFALKV